MSRQNDDDRETALLSTTWWHQYTETLRESATHQVTACVRSVAPALGQHDSRALVLSELDSVVGSGLLDSCGLTVLSDRICRCQQCQRAPEAAQLLDTVETLSGWASSDLRSCGFEERTVCSEITCEEYRVIVPPELSIGIYADDSLVGVFPSATDSDIFTPNDYVSALVARRADHTGTVHGPS